METLTNYDHLALNGAIGDIYAAQNMKSFYRSAFSAIKGVIPGELVSFNEAVRRPTRFIKIIASSQEHNNVLSKLHPVINAHLQEHPLVLRFLSDPVSMTSDVASRSRFKATALYNEYYKHLDIETQIVVSFPLSQEKTALFALSRKSPNYSERDRLKLSLLRPHVINALRNATEFGFMQLERDLLHKGAEAEKRGAVLLQSDGLILCISSFAKEMLIRYFDAALAEGDTLPGRLLTWFKAETSPFDKGRHFTTPPLKTRALKGTSKRVERIPLTVEKEDRCLKIKLLNDFTTGDYILVISEMDPASVLQNLQDYGLSCRETEVLTWLSKGKTNVEIAVILEMSKRTVEKHLEHIFAKLGVETRAAAAAVMNI